MGVTQAVGAKGEAIAADYLRQNGFVIRHANWRFMHKELDIVATKNSCLHIVEVKTRTSQYWEKPKDAVIRQKQKNIIVAANAYIRRYNINMQAQFDIISIILADDKCEIEYIPDAFSPLI